MSDNVEKIQFNLAKKYEEIYEKSIKSLKEKGIKVCEIKYEKEIVYNLSAKVKGLK